MEGSTGQCNWPRIVWEFGYGQFLVAPAWKAVILMDVPPPSAPFSALICLEVHSQLNLPINTLYLLSCRAPADARAPTASMPLRPLQPKPLAVSISRPTATLRTWWLVAAFPRAAWLMTPLAGPVRLQLG